jgi:hypothetical protein
MFCPPSVHVYLLPSRKSLGQPWGMTKLGFDGLAGRIPDPLEPGLAFHLRIGISGSYRLEESQISLGQSYESLIV